MAPAPKGMVAFAAISTVLVGAFVVYLHLRGPGTGRLAGARPVRLFDDENGEDVHVVNPASQLAPAGRICCRALTAQCLACSRGIRVAVYCSRHPNTVGCAGSSKADVAATTKATTEMGVSTSGASGISAEPVVVGDCVGNNYGMLVHPRKFSVELAQAAFPNRRVVVNVLSKECTATAETKYNHTDLIVIVWSKYTDALKTPIEKPAKSEVIRWNSDPTESPGGQLKQINGLLSYSKSRVVRHSRGRTFMIALNDEAYGQSGALYDLMIEAKLEPKYVHRHTTNLWWPLASRFLLQDGWSKSTVQDLLVPKDFDVEKLFKSKTEFCAFRHKQCDRGFYRGLGAATRVALFDAIQEHYKPCLSLGMCRLNPKAREKFSVAGGAIDRQSSTTRKAPPGGLSYTESGKMTNEPFKFAFAVENSFANGYWTEKLTNAILARTIPIVLGVRPRNETLLFKYVNMDRILYCQMAEAKYASVPGWSDGNPDGRIKFVKEKLADELKACVDKIKAVDQDDDLYKKIVSLPFLKDNSLDQVNSLFTFPIFGKYLRQSLREHESYLMEGEADED